MIMRVVQMIAMYMAMQFVMKQFMPAKQQSTEVKDQEGNVVKVDDRTLHVLNKSRTEEVNGWKQRGLMLITK